MASADMEEDVTRFISQIHVHSMKTVERNIVVKKDIHSDVTILKG